MAEEFLSPGKLPEPLLAAFLEGLQKENGLLRTPPATGEDTGAVELQNGDVLVYTSDPVTFTTARLGYLSVVINANDIATTGGRPSWYLATLMVPPGCPVKEVQAVLGEIVAACRKLNITLVGGHTEITDAVTRPVVSGTMLAVVKRDRYLEKKNAQEGDVILMSKTAGLEGTAVLAEERRELLENGCLDPAEAVEAAGFIDFISVAGEAAVAAASGAATAMHDVTEGGVATALRELGIAAGREIQCWPKQIPVHRLTEKICSFFDIDPLGLLGSGSMLICCRPESAQVMRRTCGDQGIEVSEIGRMGKKGFPSLDLPQFSADEITRVL